MCTPNSQEVLEVFCLLNVLNVRSFSQMRLNLIHCDHQVPPPPLPKSLSEAFWRENPFAFLSNLVCLEKGLYQGAESDPFFLLGSRMLTDRFKDGLEERQ